MECVEQKDENQMSIVYVCMYVYVERGLFICVRMCASPEKERGDKFAAKLLPRGKIWREKEAAQKKIRDNASNSLSSKESGRHKEEKKGEGRSGGGNFSFQEKNAQSKNQKF